MISPLHVKICGLSTSESLEWALSAGADLVGFVHFPKSPRHISAEVAATLARQVGNRAKTVVLTVDADDDLLDHLVATIAPDAIQLHGRESPERVADVRRRLGRSVIKALGIGSAEDAAGARAYTSVADLLLYDAKPPKDASRPGGLGVTFDWSLLAGAPTPFLLSGGLDPTNVEDAVRQVRPYGVDVSSGVESAPGRKDEARIRAFVAAARAANEEGQR
ncbi:phosphoribosylanthranilate isomerase [Pleomorphomonas diazotrophica]|uniref:N-(5'-phosphoribosyl)anthranilate isomerase n=1 Tax=Pleomorphomonas diazotrophica TaxID=1166257 RepID=A0A1I4SS71_9HYPH|nr:phosphoribosylanthranilate isomerase [Pleomorphomonas diazotrophica]PKR88501.1 phosphoribosylanthranilate isomerase [Pleomorphomonas diazotrophica]SFM67346.1 phosphoribosylanthranilate isomerase [Pleomorphomonas diazotrophica]